MSMLSRFATLGGAPTDPYWANVSYLLVGNGANGTTTNIVDSSSNNIATTIFGNTVISTTQSKYGSGSVYFDGIEDFCRIPNSNLTSLGTSNFTLELWYRPKSRVNNYPRIINKYESSDYEQNVWFLNDRPSGFSKFQFGSFASPYLLMSTTDVVNDNWYYLTVSRSGSNFYLFINGVLETTATDSASLDTVTSGFIGIGGTGTGANCNGYIYDFRFTKGVCRYTSTFTPPTAPLPIG